MEKLEIKSLFNTTLNNFDRPELGNKLVGKVRDVFELNDQKNLAFISTDRQSGFDRFLTLVPLKGQVLSEASLFWFNETSDIIDNHFVDSPDPNIIIGKKIQIYPVEIIVRGFLTGVTSTSVWTAYNKGIREFCGLTLPDGMVKNQPFSEPILTPTTKHEVHDENISAQEIIEKEIMSQKEWDFISQKALELFERGQKIADQQGLILVDTKYEFGKDSEGHIYLCDEIHTPDSSRFWLSKSYEERFKNHQNPENIDKEFLRLWYKENCDPYQDKILPDPPEELILELSSRYIKLYEMITGKKFQFDLEGCSSIEKRIEKNLTHYNYLK